MAEIAPSRTTYRGPFMRYRISPLDQLCFDCPVPYGCDTADERCLRKLHKAASVYIVLLKRGAMTCAEVAAAIGQPQRVTGRWLKSLQERKLVERAGGNGEKWEVRE